MISSSIDPLVALIASVAADPLAALIAAVAVLSVFFALLAWRQQRRLAVMQTQLRNLSRAVRNVEYDQERLFIKSLKSRKARKSPSSDTLEQKMAAPAQPDEKTYAGAPKNISRMKAVGD
jgi:hypothetical protein